LTYFGVVFFGAAKLGVATFVKGLTHLWKTYYLNEVIISIKNTFLL